MTQILRKRRPTWLRRPIHVLNYGWRVTRFCSVCLSVSALMANKRVHYTTSSRALGALPTETRRISLYSISSLTGDRIYMSAENICPHPAESNPFTGKSRMLS